MKRHGHAIIETVLVVLFLIVSIYTAWAATVLVKGMTERPASTPTVTVTPTPVRTTPSPTVARMVMAEVWDSETPEQKAAACNRGQDPFLDGLVQGMGLYAQDGWAEDFLDGVCGGTP